MLRLCSIIWLVSFLLAFHGMAAAASEQAIKLRGQNGLSEFAPPEAFLAGNFLADETKTNFIFYKVRDFANLLDSPTTWVIDDRK
jgi:hypothetical protein